ncbi:low temperature requirement protein A [Streptomyces cyaneofuscatus]|uniref:low temperature requirement protein A n=1 Tax=Streptomyces cyaneofuscatus TaxID=66883 RepID=UPI0038201AAB
MFHSAVEGDHLNQRLMVLGYIVMRVAMVLRWWRVYRESPEFRKVSRAEILWTLIARVCWTVIAFTRLPLAAVIVVIGTLELLLPVLAQGTVGHTPP